MSLHNNFKTFCGLFGLVFVLTSCSSAPFPEIVEDDQANVGGEITSEESNFNAPGKKTVLTESSALGADVENVAYEGESGKALPKSKGHEKIEPAKIKPVKKAELEEKRDSLAPLKDEKLKEQLKAAEKTTAEESLAPSITYLVGTVYFNNGSSSVDNSYNSQIREIVRLAKQKKAVVNVYGYSSSRTRNTDIISHKLANFNVSLARAENVAAALRRAGLPASKIKIEALSDSNPAYLEVMPEGERLNRRAEIYISY